MWSIAFFLPTHKRTPSHPFFIRHHYTHTATVRGENEKLNMDTMYIKALVAFDRCRGKLLLAKKRIIAIAMFTRRQLCFHFRSALFGLLTSPSV